MVNEDWRAKPVDWKARHEQLKPVEHNLKVWPEHFKLVKAEVKSFELRLDDRGYRVGDILNLREFDPVSEEFTGQALKRTVTCIIGGGPWLTEGYVCLGLKK